MIEVKNITKPTFSSFNYIHRLIIYLEFDS